MVPKWTSAWWRRIRRFSSPSCGLVKRSRAVSSSIPKCFASRRMSAVGHLDVVVRAAVRGAVLAVVEDGELRHRRILLRDGPRQPLTTARGGAGPPCGRFPPRPPRRPRRRRPCRRPASPRRPWRGSRPGPGCPSRSSSCDRGRAAAPRAGPALRESRRPAPWQQEPNVSAAARAVPRSTKRVAPHVAGDEHRLAERPVGGARARRGRAGRRASRPCGARRPAAAAPGPRAPRAWRCCGRRRRRRRSAAAGSAPKIRAKARRTWWAMTCRLAKAKLAAAFIAPK